MTQKAQKVLNGKTIPAATSPSDFDLETYVPYLLNRIGTALVDRFVGGLEPHGLTLPMWRVMALLYRRGPTRFGVLGGLSLIELPTLARIVAAMSDRGFVTRTRSDVDGRGTLIQLSSKGRATVKKCIPWAENVSRFTLAGLSEDEADFFKRLLLRVCRRVAPSPQISDAESTDRRFDKLLESRDGRTAPGRARRRRNLAT